MKKILAFCFLASSIATSSALNLQAEFNKITLPKDNNLVADINEMLAHVDLLINLEKYPTGNYLAQVTKTEPDKLDSLNKCLIALNQLFLQINPKPQITYEHSHGAYGICEKHIHYDKALKKTALELYEFMLRIKRLQETKNNDNLESLWNMSKDELQLDYCHNLC